MLRREGLPGRTRYVFAVVRSARRRDHAEDSVYSSFMVANMSSTQTRVSDSDMGTNSLFVTVDSVEKLMGEDVLCFVCCVIG